MSDIETEEGMGTTGALALPAKTDLQSAFENGTINKLIERIEAEVLSFVPDVSTPKTRGEIKSLAFRVAKSKKPIDEARKALTEEWRDKTERVNKSWKVAEGKLDALRDKVKAPLIEWEQADEERKAKHHARIAIMSKDRTNHTMTVAEIDSIIAEVKAIDIDDSWDEFKGMAEGIHAEFMAEAEKNREFANVRETQAAMIEKLQREKEERDRKDAADRAAKEEAERAERERAEAEERRAAEAAEAERRAAEAAEAEERRKKEYAKSIMGYINELGKGLINGEPQPYAIIMHELENKIPLEADKVGDRWPEIRDVAAAVLSSVKESFAAEQKKMAEQAERDRIEAEEKRQADIQREREEASEVERKRIADKQEAERLAALSRAADKKHRDKILKLVAKAMAIYSIDDLPKAIFDGEIPHVKIVI